MADVQEKHESKNVPYEGIFADIDLESLLKATVFLQCPQTKRVWREERACWKKPLGKCMQLFDKKRRVARIQEDYKFKLYSILPRFVLYLQGGRSLARPQV